MEVPLSGMCGPPARVDAQCMARALTLFACALALTALTAPAALADPPDVSVTVSGTIERTHVDSDTGSRPITVLSTPTGPQQVTFAGGQPVPPNGADVDLTGRLEGDTFKARSVEVTGPTIAVPTITPANGGAPGAQHQGTPLAAGTPRTVAIVVITFSNAVAPAYTDPQLQAVLTTNGNSVSNYFDEQSYGAVSFRGITNPAGDVFRVTIAANGSGCAWQTWGGQARAAVGSATINQYDHAIYVFNSQHTCGFAGLAWMPGNEVYIDNAFTLSVVSHELGHNLGVHHAASLRCSSGGQSVAFSSVSYACTPNEYGDPYDVMGSSDTNHQSAFHKLQLGWLGASTGPRVKTITTSGDYTVAPLEATSGVALLLVPNVTAGAVSDPNTTLGDSFAIDYRQPYGSYFDAFSASSPAVGGVQIRLVQSPGSGPVIQTQLLDANPQTSTFADAALVKNASFTDSTDLITITTTDVNPLGATVHVSFGSVGTGTGGGVGAGTSGGAPVPPSDTTPPTGVSNLTAGVASGPAVSLAFTAATDDRAVTRYRVYRDGVQIDELGAGATSYTDWTVTYGTRVYGIMPLDAAGNAGPMVTVTAVVSPPPVTTTPPPPPGTTPGSDPGTSKPGTPGTGTRRTTRPAIKVTMRITATSARTRKVLLTWSRAAGARRYLVVRNGRALRTTTTRRLVDASPPRGTLRYVVRVAS
jgi:hypothetical protein